MSVFDILDGDQQQDGKPTATRRQVLGATAAGATAALAGCQTGNNGSDEEPEDTPNQTNGEFSIEELLVEGEQPEQYEAEFIAGNNPEEVADQLTPELSYQIEGTNEEVQTEVQFEYSDETIPDGEPLNQTIQGETHQGNGQYTQTPQMPNTLVSEILQNPKNLQATFTATETETGETTTQEYQLNFADSYVEQIQTEAFSEEQLGRSDAEPVAINAEDGILSIEYNSGYEIGERGFEQELAGIAGLFGSNVSRTRVPYELEIEANGINGETYQKMFHQNYRINI